MGEIEDGAAVTVQAIDVEISVRGAAVVRYCDGKDGRPPAPVQVISAAQLAHEMRMAATRLERPRGDGELDGFSACLAEIARLTACLRHMTLVAKKPTG